MPLSPPHDQVPALRRTQSMIRRKEVPKLTSEELAIEQREQLSRRAVHDRSTRVDLFWSPLEAGDVPGESKGDVLPSRDVRASLESSGPTTEEDREDLSRRTRMDRFSPGFSAHTQSSPRHFHFPPPSDASRYLDPSKAYCERLGTIPNNPAQQVNGLCSSSLVAPSRLNASMHTPQGLREVAATLDGLPPPGIRNYHLPFRPEIVAPSPTRAQSLMPPSVWNGFSLARSDTSPMGLPSEFTDIPMDEIPCKANAAHPPYDAPQPISSRPSVGSFVSESTTLASKSSGLWNISRHHPAYPPTFPTKSSEEFGGGESLRDREARSVLDHFGRACKDVKSRSSGPEGMHSISADGLMRLRNARAQKVKLERKKRRGCCNCGQAFWEAIGRCLRTCSNALMRTASWFCCRRERVDSVV